jgi:hypothetical protein
MIDYPYLKEQPSTRQTLSVFRGLNRNTRIAQGEFSEMENMTSDHYPVLSPRKQRGRVAEFSLPCVITGGCYVPNIGLYFTCNERALDDDYEYGCLYLVTPEMKIKRLSSSLYPGRKSLALMGTALIIAHDMKWLDTKSDNMELYEMGYRWDVTKGKVTFSLCDAYGNQYQNVTNATDAPNNPGNMDLWLDTSQQPNCLKRYTALTKEWVTVPTTYVKISGIGNPYFEPGDGIHISGLSIANHTDVKALNGAHVIHSISEDCIVIPGIMRDTYELDCTEHPIRMERKVPQLSFVVESGNRLGGCIKNVNEIYTCKLGDFKNWNVFSGQSTDSWVGSVGTPGFFTGAINHGGYPVFYKENFKHKIWPSATGAHQITSTPCHGVERGSESSLVQLDGTIFYKSTAGIFADDGSGPVEIGQAIDAASYRNAYGGTFGKKYYLSMRSDTGKQEMFVYDLHRQLWHQEDRDYSGGLIGGSTGLYAAFDNEIWDLTGRTGTPEEEVSWRVRTGDLMLESPDRKYITRLTLRLELEPGSKLEIYARYDHEKQWQKLGMTYGRKLGSFSLPVRPRRCDHLQLELRGQGMGKIYSITKTLEEGSELP